MWGTGLKRADERLGDPPTQRASRSLQWSETGMEDPKRTPWQCTVSVCGGSALLGDLLGVSRSMKRVFLSVLFYPRFFFSFYCTVSSFIKDILHVSISWHIFLRVHCVHLVAK